MSRGYGFTCGADDGKSTQFSLSSLDIKLAVVAHLVLENRYEYQLTSQTYLGALSSTFSSSQHYTQPLPLSTDKTDNKHEFLPIQIQVRAPATYCKATHQSSIMMQITPSNVCTHHATFKVQLPTTSQQPGTCNFANHSNSASYHELQTPKQQRQQWGGSSS